MPLKKSQDDIELEKLIKQNKKSLGQSFEKNFENQEAALVTIINACRHAQHNKMKSNQVFWNAAGFISLSSYDLKVLGRELTFANNEWSRIYFSRQVCHLIYELIKDLFEILGNEFKQHINKLPEQGLTTTTLNGIRKELNSFKSKHIDHLKQVRNFASAHRDQNVLTQFEVIESISWTDTINLLTEFDRIMNSIGQLIQEIITYSSENMDRIQSR
jgi:hypothetical protein